MNLFESLLAIGNFLLLAATYPLIKSVWINRKKLTGFSKTGALLTFSGILFIWMSYIVIDSVINLCLLLPTILFWGIVTGSTWKRNKVV